MLPMKGNQEVYGRYSFDTDFIQKITPHTLKIKYLSEITVLPEEKSTVVIVLIDKIASTSGSAIISHFNMSVIGHIIEEFGCKYFSIYCSEDKKRIIITQDFPLPEELFYQTCSIITSFYTQLLVLFDGYNLSNIRPDIHTQNESYLRILQTTCFKNNKLEMSPSSIGIKTLETGAVVTGLSAALLSYCEIRNMDALTCFALRDAAYTIISAKSFESIWPLLRIYVNDSLLQLPSNMDYVIALKKDPFLISTENLYT